MQRKYTRFKKLKLQKREKKKQKKKEKQGKKGKQLPRTAKGQCRKVEVYNNNKKCD